MELPGPLLTSPDALSSRMPSARSALGASSISLEATCGRAAPPEHAASAGRVRVTPTQPGRAAKSPQDTGLHRGSPPRWRAPCPVAPHGGRTPAAPGPSTAPCGCRRWRCRPPRHRLSGSSGTLRAFGPAMARTAARRTTSLQMAARSEAGVVAQPPHPACPAGFLGDPGGQRPGRTGLLVLPGKGEIGQLLTGVPARAPDPCMPARPERLQRLTPSPQPHGCARHIMDCRSPYLRATAQPDETLDGIRQNAGAVH
jgi:hypothetical protein